MSTDTTAYQADPLAETRPLRFGDPVVCIFASEDNPQRSGLFVRWKQGRMAEVTDGNGRFWVNASVFHAADAALSPALTDAIWKKQYGA